MSKPSQVRGRRRIKADETDYDQGSNYRGNGPMEVYQGAAYTEDPSIHSTDDKPQDKDLAPQAEGQEKHERTNSDERNRVLTNPLPMVVSAPEAIEKMEMLNQLVQEGRPDLAQEAQAVGRAIDNLERKALGEENFEQHEASEGHNPQTGQPPQNTAGSFVVGDRVVMALDDGDYQGEIQKDNGDGTFDVKTDQMATFRRVPAGSIAKPDMLQPIAPRASKKELGAMPKSRVKVKAVKEGYKEVAGVQILEDGGKPRAFDAKKDKTAPAKVYVNGEGKLALVNPDGKENYEEGGDPAHADYWKQVHAMIPKAPPTEEAKKPEGAEKTPQAKPVDKNAAPPKEAAATQPAQEAVTASKTDAVTEILAEHKVETDTFYVIAPRMGMKASLFQSDKAGLTKLIASGLQPDKIMGIFAEKEAAQKFKKIVAGEGEELSEEEGAKLAHAVGQVENPLNLAQRKADRASETLATRPPNARETAKRLLDEAKEKAEMGIAKVEPVKQAIGGSVIATGTAAELIKDATFAAAIGAIVPVPQDAVINIVASKEGVVSAHLKASEPGAEKDARTLERLAEIKRETGETARVGARPNLANEDKCDLCNGKGRVSPEEPACTKCGGTGVLQASAVQASAFDEIPELEIGGGMIAKRKKAEKKEEGGEDEGDEIVVLDADGKEVATYPDAFGDDTVMIIKFLRKVLDITDKDDKKAGEAEEGGEKAEKKPKKEKEDDKAEDKPLVLPDVEIPKKDKAEDADKVEASKRENLELKARADEMEARVADARFVVEAMLRKGHIRASQDDIDAALLDPTNKRTLRQAQEVAARKAVDMEVMRLLAKPEAELRVIKASLSHLKERQVTVNASEGGLQPSNLSAAGLIYDAPTPTGSNIGLAISAAGFRR